MLVPKVPDALKRCRRVPDHTWIYSYWDREDTLLYVGRSVDAYARAQGHFAKSLWWRFVDSFTVWKRPTQEAAKLERELIKSLKPLFNIKHSAISPVPALEYCGRHDAWDLVDKLTETLESRNDWDELLA